MKNLNSGGTKSGKTNKIRVNLPKEIEESFAEIFDEIKLSEEIRLAEALFWVVKIIANKYYKANKHDGLRLEKDGSVYFLIK